MLASESYLHVMVLTLELEGPKEGMDRIGRWNVVWETKQNFASIS